MLLWTVLACTVVAANGYGYGMSNSRSKKPSHDFFFNQEPRGQAPVNEWETFPKETHSGHAGANEWNVHNVNGQLPMEGQIPMGEDFGQHGQSPMDAGQIPMGEDYGQHGQSPMEGQIPMSEDYGQHGQSPMEGQIPMSEDYGQHGQSPMDAGQIPMEDHDFGGQMPLSGGEEFHQLSQGQEHGQSPVDIFGAREPAEEGVQSDMRKTGYGYGGSKSYRERHYGYGKQGIYNSHNSYDESNSGKYRAHGYGGYGHHLTQGCKASLTAPMNSKLECSTKSDCTATCIQDYAFPSGVSELSIICDVDSWKVKDALDYHIPSCSPTCLPACQNNGECTQPNYCQCPENFYGPYCQYERKPCSSLSVLPQNSRMTCMNKQKCHINCRTGHQFPDGSTSAEVNCKEGEWVPVNWSFIPDCEVICSPRCENGGICLSFNQCQCPQEFRGPQCQYSVDSCDVRVLGFNGNYNCSGDHESLKCEMKCPLGMTFTETPSDLYICRYELGIFIPSSVPRCIFEKNKEDELLNYVFPDSNNAIGYHSKEVLHSSKYFHANEKDHEVWIAPKKESLIWSCYTWHGDHYRTFDGNVKNFKNDCSKNMVDGDLSYQKFKIETPVIRTCDSSDKSCSYLLVGIDLHNFNFSVDSLNKLTIKDGNLTYTAPKQLDLMKVELGSNSMTIHVGKKLTIKWNFKDFVDLKIEKASLNLVTGICGVVNQEESGMELLSNNEGVCSSEPNTNCADSPPKEAKKFCGKILKDPKFAECRKTLNAKVFYEACILDFCDCKLSGQDSHNCGCQTISMFIKECREHDVKIDFWREHNFCPINCEGGKIYSACGKDSVCGGVQSEGNLCEEGCFCPDGTYSHENTCIPQQQCPCKLRGRSFAPGKEIPKDCNTCTCNNGSWVCTKLKCSARCEAVGDPHYLTFDKMNYEFMGKCSYIMLQTENYTIETENTPCDGAISESMGYSTYFYKDVPSCTKAVTVKMGDTEIKLKQGKQVTVNGIDHKIPATLKKVHVRRASSIFIQVSLDDGVDVLWDGKTRVYIQVPPSLKGNTKGLCGTFNGKRSDDFLTPEGDIEQDSISFGNKWKTKESCPTMNTSLENPCSKVDSKVYAEALNKCNMLNGPIFKECELEDNEKEIYHKFCMYDMCACNHKLPDCYCPIISAFADRCSKAGHRIDWRPKIRDCGLRCPRGQVYEVCGNSCGRSCLDISRKNKCTSSCLEGCYCPPGYTMDHREICIPISECPCIRKGLDYPAGHNEIRPDAKGPQLCTCRNALWSCHKAVNEELTMYQNNTVEDKICSNIKNQVYTHCEPSTPLTCQNMHSHHKDQSEAVCYGGCVCKKGYVLDSLTKDCVKPDQCPCHHGGKSFHDEGVIYNECNTCKCKSGKWNCTDHICPGVCTTWGDSHFKTFDGKVYDFQGSCEYVLAKGAISPAAADCFSIIVELVPCGSSGVSCSKSVTLNVGSGDSKETLIFSDGKAIESMKLERIVHRETELYLFAEVFDLGLVLQWDKGTIISVKMDPKWKNRVKGLCGNFNSAFSDDFQTPSGGEETSVEIFGDSWKIYDYCPNAEQVKDTCSIHPSRRAWAMEKCAILKSQMFKRCHSEVQVDPYLERCVFDTCGCDQGGDCNCLCTAITAYAQECNAHGVPIKWRSQQLCPIQCDETCSEYSPCIPTCPLETCDNMLAQKQISSLCKQDACVEGCHFKQCPEGQVYRNDSKKDCVPKADCEPVCMVINEKKYFEGDVIESDECHRCFCTHNQKSCLGQPCTTPLPTTELLLPHDQTMTCKSGWSEWINSHFHIQGSFEDEIEPLPQPNDFKESLYTDVQTARCTHDKMVNINCRTVGSHLNVKDTNDDVECSLERGLFCTKGCHDYEIQVLCQCEPATTHEPTLPTTEETICDMSHPFQPNYLDCSHYYECQETIEGIKYVDQHCEKGTLFSNATLTCEPEIVVYESRPECDVIIKEQKSEVKELESPSHGEDKDNMLGCADGEVWDKCAYRCDQLCNYAEAVLFKERCEFGPNCLEGCRPITPCPSEKRWRDLKTCVDVDDCTCASLTNEIIKPGEVVKGNCSTCQCHKNVYNCHEVDCHTTTATTEPPPFTTHMDIIIVPSTSTPPPACEDDRFVPLLPKVPNSAFSASSTFPGSSPSHSRLNNTGSGWTSGIDDIEQYLEIDLGKVEIIYGVVVLGIPVEDAFVQTFYVLYSIDGASYSYVSFVGIPELFKGPTLSSERVKRLFDLPVEARYVRINPSSWFNKPSMKVELLGCGFEVSTTAAPTTIEETTPESNVCNDDMSHMMNDQQIKASSTVDPLTSSMLSIHGEKGWTPLTIDANQWIEFDFMGKRTLTGVSIAGSGSNSDGVPSWVTSFSISYSHDGEEWNPVVNKEGHLQIFKGNSDNESVKKIMFWEPIFTRFVRINPIKWHRSITVRAQILGCYEPYPTLPSLEVEETTLAPKQNCNLCPGATIFTAVCPCLKSNEWWDGEQCTTRSRCPCFVGFISYAIGSVFDNERCEQCVCALNGIIECKAKKCPPCEEGLKNTLTPVCGCLCKPCPEGERLCSTSNICIPTSSWCNGVIDCPDDELNCTVLSTTQRIETQTCPAVECPEGFTAVATVSPAPIQETQPQWSPFGSKSKWGSYFKGKGMYTGYGSGKGSNKGKYGYNKSPAGHNKSRYGFGAGSKTKTRNESITAEMNVCPQYQCQPIDKKSADTCQKPNCLPKYELIITEENPSKCPQYSCVLQKIKIPDGKCNVTGRTFTTFDGTEYKYDICDHVIARNKVDKNWSVKKLKNCGGRQVPPCLQINHENDTILITKDFTTYYNNYPYTLSQLQKVGAQNVAFTIKQASDKFIIFASILDFSLIWDAQGNIKITVPGESRTKIDGLCGYFDNQMDNDKMKPDGSMAKTSVEFGESWGESIDCEIVTCPLHIQKEAWDKCKAFKEDPLLKCSSVINIDKLMSQCVESMCTCIQQGNSSDECICQSILETVTECQSKLPGVDLSRWRMNYDCPVDCPSGLVYKECFNKICEPCCAELMLEEACPETTECFPGCYCPDGYVRSMDKCVKPAECRDCQCDGYGNSRYVTFDRMDFTFNGKCTHTLAQTIENSGGLQFKALITHKPCEDNDSKMCLYMITILYKEHTLQAIIDNDERVTVKVNGENIEKRPFSNQWVTLVESQGKCVTLSLPKLQLDLEVFNQGKGFNLKLPSHIYRGKTEGLCGSCNLNGTDDFKMRDGLIVEDVSQFGESWLVTDLPPVIGKEKSCETEEINECQPPSDTENDQCLKLMQENLFGQCHAVVDPTSFIASCHEDLCHQSSICLSLESYARECQSEGICLNWRTHDLCPYKCPKGLEYEPCGIGCTETCDNYELYRNSPEACTATKGDTCSCPPGKVLRNDTCVEEKICTPCDGEGHYPGDKWQPDTCTECSCEKGTIQCQRIQCTNTGTICSRGFKSITVAGTDSDCCPKHICIPEPTAGPICPDPVQPQCGFGQVMKLITSSSGCQEFICECKPKDECEDTAVEMEKDRAPGMVASLDTSGCCPNVVVNCKIGTCPTPAPCPEHHVLTERDTELCCPIYKCAIPEGKCLYEMNYINSEKGGERERILHEKHSVLKSVGETWNDGPCRVCECKEGDSKASCTATSCSPPPESANYVLEPSFVNEKCCPIYKRKACKIGHKVYEVGQVWPSPDNNPCINMTCEISKDSEIAVQELIETCNKDCKEGWKYHEPAELTGQCCGECRPEGCLAKGVLHKKEAIWFSEDNCTAYLCIIEDNQIHVASSQENCPDLSHCPAERIYQDRCCQKCNETIIEALTSCLSETIPPSDTIGIVVYHDKTHGKCVNKSPIEGFTECKGSCDSSTLFDKVELKYKTKCLCCQPEKTYEIVVPLNCDDHYIKQFYLKQPKTCKCIPCENEANLIF